MSGWCRSFSVFLLLQKKREPSTSKAQSAAAPIEHYTESSEKWKDSNGIKNSCKCHLARPPTCLFLVKSHKCEGGSLSACGDTAAVVFCADDESGAEQEAINFLA